MPWPATSPLSFAGVGDNIIVVAGDPSHRVKVWRLYLVVADDVVLTFKDGPTINLSGPISMRANGSIVFDMIPGTRESDTPWFRTSPGNDFIINLSAGVQVSGGIYFSIGAAID